LSRSTSFTGSLVPRKHLAITSAVKGARVYGPEEPSERKDEVHHWTNERYVALALIPIIPSAIIFPNMVMDTALCGAMLLHTHWRLSGVVQDYIHGSLYHICKYLVLILSITSFGSLCYFNYADVGFANAARLIFTKL
jgi:succinate dehydrogenase (ubiquinone) membrane anchor subunit